MAISQWPDASSNDNAKGRAPHPRPVRVDFVSPRFHPTRGGIETAMEGVASELLRRGHDVTVHTTHFPELAFEESWQGIRIRRYKPFPQLGYYASWFRPDLSGDIVHLHAYAHATNDGVIRRHAGQRPLFLSTHHGLAFPRRGLGRAYHALYNRLVGLRSLRRLSALLVPTRFDADLFERRGVPPKKIRVLPTGLGEEAFAPAGPAKLPWPPDRPFVLYLGRLHEEKGVYDLLEAYERKPLPFDLVFAGPDEGARLRLEQRARRSAAGSRVHFAGHLEPGEKWAALDACEFLVVPSHHEGQGIVVSEAWARGKAVVATRAGALPALVRDGEDGVLVAVKSPAALFDALERVAGDPALRQRLGAAGRRRAESEFRRSVLVDRLVSDYEDALSGNARGSTGAPARAPTA